MLRRTPKLEAFEREQIRSRPSGPDGIRQAFRIYEALYVEARRLGVLPGDDPLAGIDVDIRLAKALHVRRPAREDRPGAG